MKTRILALIAAATTCLPAAPEPEPFGPVPSQAQMAWHELEMYAFVHFTTNTFTGKEWGFGDENPAVFNPTDFDADQIVGTLAKSGFKSVILTCKHHDGFCLWPTKTTGHNISKSPWKNGKGDMVREFSDAARRHGIGFGVYLSPWDRNNANYGTPRYVEIYREQLRELLTGYGPLMNVWHDGANGGDGYYGGAVEKRSIGPNYYEWPRAWQMTRELQPKAAIFSDVGPDVRWIGNEKGFANYPCWATYTPKGRNGAEPTPGSVMHELGTSGTVDGKFWMPGECDVSIRPGWFWHEEENGKVRPPADLLNLYFQSVGHGASFLLNLPPDRRGRIHENDVRSLAGFKQALDHLYAVNFADAGTASATASREGFPASNLLDKDQKTYWAAPAGVTSAEITLTLPETRAFDIIKLREAIHLGQRVRKFVVDFRKDGQWKEWISNGSSIGAHTLLRGEPIHTDAIRLRLLECAAPPCLSELSLWLMPTGVPDHLDAPDAKNLANDGWRVSADIETTGHPAAHAIDGNPATFWSTRDAVKGEQGPPRFLTIDLGREQAVGAVTFLPRQDGKTESVVDRYRLEWSADGNTWSAPREGEFSNIRANPVEQTVTVPAGTRARYFRFTALSVLDGTGVTLADVGFHKPD